MEKVLFIETNKQSGIVTVYFTNQSFITSLYADDENVTSRLIPSLREQ